MQHIIALRLACIHTVVEGRKTGIQQRDKHLLELDCAVFYVPANTV